MLISTIQIKFKQKLWGHWFNIPRLPTSGVIVQYIRFAYPAVSPIPFFVYPNWVGKTFSGVLSCIFHPVYKVVNYQAKKT